MNGAFDWPVLIFSSDTDWASEACIEDAYQFISKHSIKPCFFVTHQSAVLQSLENAAAVELGLHPNFLPGSDHGEDQDEVIETVRGFAPRAGGFRSHCFVDSTFITRKFKAEGLTWDSNLCLYLQEGIVPMRHCSGLTRVPVFWADDVHMSLDPDEWSVDALIDHFLSPGLKVIDVHPVHLALNTPDLNFYNQHKHRVNSLSADELVDLRHPGAGTRTFLDDLIARLREADVRMQTFEEVLAFGTPSNSVERDAVQSGRNDNLSAKDHTRYWAMSADERQTMLRDMYNQRDPLDPYATSRDQNQRDLEITVITEALPEPPIDVVVDLGCGNGYTLLSIAKSVNGSKFIGVDFANKLIEGAKQMAIELRDELKSQPQFICGDAIEFTRGLDSASTDCVITERFLLNLLDVEAQEAEIKDIYRVLRPGGRLLMCEGSREGFLALNRLRTSIGLEEIAETSVENVSSVRFNDAEIESFVTDEVGFEMIEKSGFSVFFAISRALYPRLIRPHAPRFAARINVLARELQEHSPMQPGLGSNVLWVLQKPLDATA